MGRVVNYDNLVEDQIDLLKKNDFQSGLIIGQSTDQRDYVIRLCPTPKKDDEEIPKITEKKGKNKSTEEIPAYLDEPWICQHAKQLVRSLPGGFDILGFYVVSSDQGLNHQSEIKKILFSVFKILGRNKRVTMSSNERIMLTICPHTYKITCRTCDISDFKSSVNPAEWKLQSGILQWQRLRCQLAIDIKFPIRSEYSGLSLQKQIEEALDPFLTSIDDSYTLLNGVQRDADELLDVSVGGKKSKKKQTGQKSDQSPSSEWWEIDFFLPLKQTDSTNPETFDCVCMMTFKGVMECRAYIHGKALVQEAISALKKDVIRSLTARCEIHCEDLLLIEEEQKDPYVVHELPRRVFAPLPQPDLTVCDYQFHGDTAADSLDAFKELLDLDLSEEDIDTSCEVSPTTSTLILPEVTEDKISEFGDTPKHSSTNPLIPFVGVIAAVAVGVASLLYVASAK